MRVLVREAVESGSRLAVVASSGNAAISASSLCSRAGLGLVVVVPTTLSPVTLGLLSRFPILVIQYGAGPAESHALARELAKSLDAPNLSSTFSSSGAEFGCRTLGHEIAYQLPDVNIETISASISVGPVLLGTRNGLLEAGKPRAVMVAGQALGCSPIVRAFETEAAAVVPWSEPVTTAAASIADTLASYSEEATFFLGELRDSGGFMAAADDDALAKIRRQLREVDGVDVELACCAAIYALILSGKAGALATAVLTGSGQRETLKNNESLEANRHPGARTATLLSGDITEAAREVLAWQKK
jgi:threonine synthase